MTFQRDPLWLEAFGRYLWQTDRDPQEEEDTGSPNWPSVSAAKSRRIVLRWYEETGPILPGLQNLTSVFHSNWAPTATGSMQRPDVVLEARWLDPKTGKFEASGGSPNRLTIISSSVTRSDIANRS